MDIDIEAYYGIGLLYIQNYFSENGYVKEKQIPPEFKDVKIYLPEGKLTIQDGLNQKDIDLKKIDQWLVLFPFDV